MRDIVNLSNFPIDLDSNLGRRFVVDATRAGEGLISDLELQQAYDLSPTDWGVIIKDTQLGKLIRAERDRRVLNGTAVREASAKHLIKGPTILAEIMTGENNARHKIDAFVALRQTAIGDKNERPTASETFSIRIDLTAGGGEVEVYNKPYKTIDEPAAIAGDAHEIEVPSVDVNRTSTKPQRTPRELALEALMKFGEE